MAPRDLIELGAVRGAYGLKGWARIAPFAADGVVLESVRRWWLLDGPKPVELMVEEVRRHTDSILAKWAGCESKEAADALKGATIAVARSDFPALDQDEHYLSDMVGYRVINRQGLELGTICGIRSADVESRSTAAAQWLEVSDGDPREAALLIPLVDRYVEAIEPEGRLIRVDWESNW